MAETTTPRFGLHRWSDPADTFSRDELDADHGQLEDLAAGFLQGLASARPAASAAVAGFFFHATDTDVLSYCDGASWVDYLGALAVPRGYLGHATRTSDVSLNTTPKIVCQVTVPVLANRRLRVTGRVYSVTDANNNAEVASLNLDDGTTSFGSIRIPAEAVTGHHSGSTVVGYLEVTAAGNVTFFLRSNVDSGDATLVAANDHTHSLLLVEDIGRL